MLAGNVRVGSPHVKWVKLRVPVFRFLPGPLNPVVHPSLQGHTGVAGQRTGVSYAGRGCMQGAFLA